jgi:hypothetical protein
MTPSLSKKHTYIIRLTLSKQERGDIFMLANELAAADALIAGIDCDNMAANAGTIEKFSIRRYTEQILTILGRVGIVKALPLRVDYDGSSIIYTQVRTEFLAV